MTRRCPRCHTTFHGDEQTCPQDGAALVADDSATSDDASSEVPRGTRPHTAGYTDNTTLSGEVFDGRYEVVRRLGEGGMSYVYQARDRDTGELVAVKVLSPLLIRERVAVERLRREAKLAMQLHHEHICPILRLGELENGLLYLVMPYLPGELLADRLERSGPLPLVAGIGFLVQICAGLHHAHQLHIVHRDLKPENVMIVPDDQRRERAVLLDFGLAKSVDAAGMSLTVTGTGMVPGTPEFMSPEQVRGDRLDPRSDIYALGVLASEVFTGQLPFEGRTTQQIMVSRLESPPRRVREFDADLPAALEAVLLKAMSLDPKDRYQTMRDFGEALADVIDEAGARPHRLLR